MKFETRNQRIVAVIAVVGIVISTYWGWDTLENDPGLCRSIQTIPTFSTEWHECSWVEKYLARSPESNIERKASYLAGAANFARGLLWTLAVIGGFFAYQWIKRGSKS